MLDVSFDEDDCMIYRDKAAAHLAVIRHIVVNMMRQEKNQKAEYSPEKTRTVIDAVKTKFGNYIIT